MKLKAPFPYFGGKSRIAGRVWQLLGSCKRYIEPFFGSGAVLLNRPDWRPGMDEIVNDKDGHVANVWRAIRFAPDEVASWCDWPVNHADLNARRKVLREQTKTLLGRLVDDPEYCDARLAGYWIWGASCWIGGGMLKEDTIPNLSNNKGINRRRPQLTCDNGIHAKRPHLAAKGIQGKIPCLAHERSTAAAGSIRDYLEALAARFRHVKVVCGDWSRVCGGNWQNFRGTCGIFFDPPYSDRRRDKQIYHVDDMEVASAVRRWCLERGGIAGYRIVLCGYTGEHDELLDHGWRVEAWKAQGGYANLRKSGGENNAGLERLWISPQCLANQSDLFEEKTI